MNLNAANQHALALRMGCVRSGTGNVIVSARNDGAPSSPESTLTLKPTSQDDVAQAISDYVDSNGQCPAEVVIGDDTFDLSAPETSGRIAGKVAIVTGSGQGFGKGIAEGLADHGAHVVIADINAETGERAAAEIRDRCGSHSAIFAPLNVTDLSSIEECLDQTIRAFGGVDLFIANAGVVKSGGLDELDEKSFNFVTDVNYKGYFLCVKAVSEIMRQQNALNPILTMDIVQINSKSGLEGSRRNFAYSGSKFGGIGLTQSFALELVPYNIKVNAVCPGNYFDGPLWSDPENGLFLQYLNSGKVEGAKTVDDVRAFYMSKVPMGRGCLPEDVVRAILYLHEQEYETGQALPVSGGQTMLN